MKCLINIENWQVEYIEDDSGNKWKIEGNCNPKLCKASCCMKGDKYCEKLNENTFLCKFEAIGGARFNKPLLCSIFPWKQDQIDSESNCTLRLVPYGYS